MIPFSSLIFFGKNAEYLSSYFEGFFMGMRPHVFEKIKVFFRGPAKPVFFWGGVPKSKSI